MTLWSLFRFLFLIDFPIDTSWNCFPLPPPYSTESWSELSLEDTPDTCCSVCLSRWKCVCVRKVRGKGRSAGHHGLKGKVIITVVNYGCSNVSCILLCLHAPAPWPCFLKRKAFPFSTWKHCQSPLFMCVLGICVCPQLLVMSVFILFNSTNIRLIICHWKENILNIQAHSPLINECKVFLYALIFFFFTYITL